MYKEYAELVESGGYRGDSVDRTLREKCARLLCDSFSQEHLFGSPAEEPKHVQVTYRKEGLLFRKAGILEITVPAKYFLFLSEQFNPGKDHLHYIVGNYDYNCEDYSYEVRRAEGAKSLEDVSIVFSCPMAEQIDTGETIEKGQMPLTSIWFQSDSVQYDGYFPAISSPEILKGFRCEVLEEKK